ncbi:MAG: ABC transporter permease [Thermaceae bacterium]|nr:ABC transporter permease [Thermaceae bacterium]
MGFLTPGLAMHRTVRKGLFWKFLRHKSGSLGLALSLVFLLMALFGPGLAPYDPSAADYSHTLSGISTQHWLGTDNFGRDLLSRTLVGARYSLGIGILATLIGAGVGGVWGLWSGYAGGFWDSLSMRLVDVLLAFPGLLPAIGLIAITGPGLLPVIMASAFFSVPIFARLVRGSTLQMKERAYIEAAHALGAGSRRVMRVHLLPSVLAPVLVYVTLRIGTVMLIASSLSFLGLGVQPPTPEWGAMLSDAQLYLATDPLLAIAPGLAITLTVLGLNLLGDGLRDTLDPKLK